MQVFKITGTLKNKEKIDKGGEEMILMLGLANYDPMKMMESLKKSYEHRNYVLEHTWEYLNRRDVL